MLELTEAEVVVGCILIDLVFVETVPELPVIVGTVVSHERARRPRVIVL